MEYKKIFEAVSGNVIGIVEEPTPLDPDKGLQVQRRVKIGVLDRNGDLPKRDAMIVIQKLRAFVENILN